MRTRRRFNYGQPSWLNVEYHPDRSAPQSGEPDLGYQGRAGSPQEPERDFLPPDRDPGRLAEAALSFPRI
jgi:hypothetical protein